MFNSGERPKLKGLQQQSGKPAHRCTVGKKMFDSKEEDEPDYTFTKSLK